MSSPAPSASAARHEPRDPERLARVVLDAAAGEAEVTCEEAAERFVRFRRLSFL